MNANYEAIQNETAEKIVTYFESHWTELRCCCLENDISDELRAMIRRAIRSEEPYRTIITEVK